MRRTACAKWPNCASVKSWKREGTVEAYIDDPLTRAESNLSSAEFPRESISRIITTVIDLQINCFGMLIERIADKRNDKKNVRVSSIQMLNNLFFIRQARSFKYQIKLIIIRSIALHSMSCLRINFFFLIFLQNTRILSRERSLSRPKENWLTGHDLFFFF